MESSSSQGRFYLLENGPVASPGHCAVCGFSGPERRYLDPRLDFEFFGSCIFCETCVTSMAQIFGLLSESAVADLEKRVENAERELIQLRAVVTASEAFDVAVRAYSSGGHISSDPGFNIYNDDSIVSGSNKVTNNSSQGESAGESAFDVSTLVEGPDDLSDLGSPASSSIEL